MPLWLVVLIVGFLGIGTIAVLVGSSLNDWLNSHRWVLPAVSFLLVLVIALIVGEFSTALRADQVAACERRNPEVAGEVENLENDRAFLRVLRGVVKELLPAEDPRREAVVDGATLAITRKSEAIGSKVSARSRYSENPGAKSTEAVIVDCEAQYHTGP